MNPADIFALIDLALSIIGIAQRNAAELTPDQREVLHERTRAMIAQATALITPPV